MTDLTIETVSNLRWYDAAHETLTADVKFAEFEEPHPFGMSVYATRQYQHETEFWDTATSGGYGPIAPYQAPTNEEIRASMRPLTARQFRLGLLNAGISPSTVTATIAAMPAGPDRDKAQIEWEFATTFNRMHPLIATVGAALGLTDQQIDAMWRGALGL